MLRFKVLENDLTSCLPVLLPRPDQTSFIRKIAPQIEIATITSVEPPTTFPRFPRLPLEIRRMIWRRALPSHRVIAIPSPKCFGPATASEVAALREIHTSEKSPSILFVNRESREEALKFCVALNSISTSTVFNLATSATSRSKSTTIKYIVPENDIVVLPLLSNQKVIKYLSRKNELFTMGGKIRRLALRSAFDHMTDLSERLPFAILEHAEELFVDLGFLDSKGGVVGFREVKNWDEEGYVETYWGNFGNATKSVEKGLQALKDAHPDWEVPKVRMGMLVYAD